MTVTPVPGERLRKVVAERATHRDKDKVGDTRSFGNMEQTLVREYWGRFLIELIQNARDAWLDEKRSGGARLIVRLTSDPALVVANSGTPITEDVVLDSISKIGESTKPYGESIGYKGIGFKAVLEVSATPEIYSRQSASDEWDLRVTYDPDEATALVRRLSPKWDALVADLASSGHDEDGDERIPVLRFPLWVDQAPVWLEEFAAAGTNTVVRLPYDPRYDTRLGLSRDVFVEKVRSAFDDITDEIVLLTGVFDEIVLADEIAGTATVIERRLRHDQALPEGIRVSEVEILRDGNASSRWWTWERRLEGFETLEGDILVGARLAPGDDGRLVPILPQDAGRSSQGDCFHLFFPTRIKTHLPLLFHSYFEVDASRKGFASDKVELNTQLLDGLRSLAVTAVRYLTRISPAGEVAIEVLPELFQRSAGTPDDPLAASFREHLLHALDSTKFIPTEPEGRRELSAPLDLLVDARGPLPSLIPQAFPATYVREQLDRHFPDGRISAAGLQFLESRTGVEGRLSTETLRTLLRPGARDLWPQDPDRGFRALLEVLTFLTAVDRTVADVLADLGQDREALIVPVIDGTGGRRMRSPPRPSREGGTDQILARIRSTGDSALAPPSSVPVDFLADGVVDDALLNGVAGRLGIRPYTTDTVLDALAAADPAAAEHAETLRFVWGLLLREALSDAGLRATLGRSTGFDPGAFWWLASSGTYLSDAQRVVQKRMRALATSLVPAADGSWQPAGTLVFGSAWADWLATQEGAAARERASAYGDLEASAPSQGAVVAGPDTFADMLPFKVADASWVSAADAPSVPPRGRDRHLTLIHALLLRLGVWEIPPVEAFSDVTERPADRRDPWAGQPGRLEHDRLVRRTGAFHNEHDTIHVGEDVRLLWSLTSESSLVAGLNRGVGFYRQQLNTLRYCPRCRDHKTRELSTEDGRLPSMLSWQLRSLPWVPARRQGGPVAAMPPRDVWHEREVRDQARLLQSWPRFLPLLEPNVSDALADLAGISSMDSASVNRVRRLLKSLRQQFDDGEIEPDRRSTTFAGQAFTSLHRRAYQRLTEVGEEHAGSVAEEVGVLAVRGKTLVYTAPNEARHDDAVHAGQKRFFFGVVPFVTLDREQVRAADALGVPRFRLAVERLPSALSEDVTDEVRSFVHQRAAEFLALQVYYPLTGQTLQLDSRAFSERAARLRELRAVRVDVLRLELRLVDGEAVVAIGGERDEEAYLDLTASPPTLFHDFAGEGWQERLKRVTGPQIAALLDNAAYANTFSLLLQQETEAQREAFFAELNIADEDLEVVRAHVGAEAGVLDVVERRWWTALLPMLGADVPQDEEPRAFREAVSTVFADLEVLAGSNSLGDVLLRSGGGDPARRDTSPGGALASLEAQGIALADLDARLKALGDQGLDIGVARTALAAWKTRHANEVIVVLTRRAWALEAATAAVGAWRVSAAADYRVSVPPSVYLEPVVETLTSAGLSVDVERLASADVSDYLADLVGETVAVLSQEWNALANEEVRGQLQRSHANAWRRILVPIIVAVRTQFGELPFRIRAEVTAVNEALPASPADPSELIPALTNLLGPTPIFEHLETLIEARSGTLALPDDSEVYATATSFVDPEHLAAVREVMRRGSRTVVDAVRHQMQEVRELDLTPQPVAGLSAPPKRRTRVPGDRRQVGGRRRRDQGHLDRLGLDAEQWVRAATLATLTAMDHNDFAGAVRSMQALLNEVAAGPRVAALNRRAEEALQAVDDDDRLEALTEFVHVALTSDDFGFDLLGWVSPYAGAEQRPMLLEVKNSADRSFHVSVGEWELSEGHPDDYAFCIVIRAPQGRSPLGMEVIPDPKRQVEEGRLARREDGWIVTYRVTEGS